MIMRFNVFYGSVIFFTIMTKLFVISDSKESQLLSDEQDLVRGFTVTDEFKTVPNFHQQTNPLPENADVPVFSPITSTSENSSDSSDNYPGSKLQQASEPRPNLLSNRAQSNEMNQQCVPLRPTVVITTLPKILSFDIFSQADPAHYLLNKSIKLSVAEVRSAKYEVDLALDDKKLPQCYIPFANLLSSFLKCWEFLLRAKLYLVEIQKKRLENVNSYVSLPIDISSSPEVSELFSSDIFSDPKPPLRLLNKLFKMSENTFAKVKDNLRDFVDKWTGTFRSPFALAYVRYANAVYPLFHNELLLKKFKQDLSEIQRINEN